MKNINLQRLCPSCMKGNILDGVMCDKCGFSESRYEMDDTNLDSLPLRTIIDNKYMIGEKIGRGGFGITYAAYDITLQKKICIKELFPEFVVRMKDLNVQAQYGYESKFDELKDKTLDEARRLAKLNNLSGVVSVIDFVECNNTTYIVMDFVEGVSLGERISLNSFYNLPTRGEFVLNAIKPMIKSLYMMHCKKIIHRDISPDNLIYNVENKSITLVDFGTARDIGEGDVEESFTAEFKHGYAPLEQYKGTTQGPWTDVYGLCSTIYALLTGIRPPDVLSRISGEKIHSFEEYKVYLTKEQEEAIIKGLSINVEDRFKTMKELYEKLYGVSIDNTPVDSNIVSSANKYSCFKKYIKVAVGMLALGLSLLFTFDLSVTDIMQTIRLKLPIGKDSKIPTRIRNQNDFNANYVEIYKDAEYVLYLEKDLLVKKHKSKSDSEDSEYDYYTCWVKSIPQGEEAKRINRKYWFKHVNYILRMYAFKCEDPIYGVLSEKKYFDNNTVEEAKAYDDNMDFFSWESATPGSKENIIWRNIKLWEKNK